MKGKVDLEEFNRQRIEAGKEKGHYSEILIFLEEGENSPLTKLAFSNISTKTMAKNIVILQQLKDYLEKTYPVAYLMSKELSAEMLDIEND